MLHILGLGAGELKLLTLEAYQILKNADEIYLRTKNHPIVNELEVEGLKVNSFDHFYQQADTFEQVYNSIIEEIITKDFVKENIVYAVPGHPLVAEDTVQGLIKKLESSRYKIIAGPSFVDAIFSTLAIDPIDGIKILDALLLTARDLDPSVRIIISQVYNQQIASQLKLTLMEIYPDDFEIKVLRGAGMSEERVETIKLYQLDRLDWIDHLTSVYLPVDEKNPRNFNRLLEIMEILRSDDGCPWDLEQDHYSLKKHLIEEAYEVIERIEKDDLYGLANELGDLLLQVVFHAQIAKQEGNFNIYDVIFEINQKMVRRHPHIFADVSVDNAKEVLQNWEEIKTAEKAGEEVESLLDVIPIQLPALIQSQKLQFKAAQVGFDWKHSDQVFAKVEEEIIELKEAIIAEVPLDIKEEFGDLIFSLVNLARFLDVDAEIALRGTINKFKRRFAYIENKVRESNSNIEDLSLEELDNLWDRAKKSNKGDE